MIVGVSRDRLSSVWHEVEPILGRLLKRQDYHLGADDVLAALEKAEMQLWMTHDVKLVWLTQIVIYPRYKVFLIIAACGEGDKELLREADALFTAFASHHGCRYVEVQGRKGWVRLMQPLGYEPTWITIRKEV